MLWEFSFLNWLQKLHTPVLDRLMIWITHLGDRGWLFILLGITLLCMKRTRRCGASVLTALSVGALACNVILKPLAQRARPCWVNNAVQLLTESPKDFSFPSGHTQAAFAAATVIFLYDRRWGMLSYAAACLIAFSRLYLYVHFPTDVLAGLLLGIAAGWLGTRIVDRVMKRCERLHEKGD